MAIEANEPALTQRQASDVRIEALARLIAAEQMGLVRDPTGAKLAYAMYSKALVKANAVMTLIRSRANGDEA
jgi:hypothetical protein